MSEILSGIYKIYCKDTNKYYIGQSVNVKKRLRTHLNELRNNNHINQSLQRDFNTCGEGAFIFEKIKDVEEEFLNIFEKYYMEYYDALKKGYNVIPMDDLISKKYMNKSNLDIFKGVEYIEVPLIAGDIYVNELFLRLGFVGEDTCDAGTVVSDDIYETVQAMCDFEYKRHKGFWDEVEKIVELEVRRKFNRLGIMDVSIKDIDNIYEFLQTKIFKVSILIDGKNVDLNVKCTK